MEEEDDIMSVYDQMYGPGSDPAAQAYEKLGDLTSRYSELEQEEMALRKQQQAERKARFEEAQRRLAEARFGNPTRAENLLQISGALLSPRRYRGLAGTLDNVVPAFQEQAFLENRANDQRAQAMAELEASYSDAQMAEQIDTLGARGDRLTDLMDVYGKLAKPKSRRTGHNPVDGRLQYMDTGEYVEQAAAPTPDQFKTAIGRLSEYLANPEASEVNKRRAVMDLSQKLKLSPAQVMRMAGGTN